MNRQIKTSETDAVILSKRFIVRRWICCCNTFRWKRNVKVAHIKSQEQQCIRANIMTEYYLNEKCEAKYLYACIFAKQLVCLTTQKKKNQVNQCT